VGRWKRWTEKEIEEFVRLYKDGMMLKDLAYLFGVNRMQVTWLRNALGLEKRK
jgi:hypothetical protein